MRHNRAKIFSGAFPDTCKACSTECDAKMHKPVEKESYIVQVAQVPNSSRGGTVKMFGTYYSSRGTVMEKNMSNAVV